MEKLTQKKTLVIEERGTRSPESGRPPSPIIPPGERVLYRFTAQISTFRPARVHLLTLVRDRECPVRLVGLAQHGQPIHKTIEGPVCNVSFLKTMGVAQTLDLSVENRWTQPALVRVVVEGRCHEHTSHESESLTIFPAEPASPTRSLGRRHIIPARGSKTILCRFERACRPTRVRILSDSQLDVRLSQVRVGNRMQLGVGEGVPVEMYAREGREVECDAIAHAQDFRWDFENESPEEDRFVEIEVDALVAE
jgi:hypothetical protein